MDELGTEELIKIMKAFQLPKVQSALKGRRLIKVIYVPNKIINFITEVNCGK